MSGIEIVGIAASVIQIADLGARLSVRLFVFSKKIRSADKAIEAISQDIAATGAVLRELGLELSKDENAELCTNGALSTAKNLIAACQKVFDELNAELEGQTATVPSIVMAWKARLKYSFLEAQIELLRSNLERLKSTLTLMLNVLIFAVQVRSHRNITTLRDQRALVEILIEDKNASESRYQHARKAIGWKDPPDSPQTARRESPDEASTRAVAECIVHKAQPLITTVNTASTPSKLHGVDYVAPAATEGSDLPDGLRSRRSEIKQHILVIERLLLEVHSRKHIISNKFRRDLRYYVLYAHWKYWDSSRLLYGDEAHIRAFAGHADVVQFWKSRLENKVLNDPRGRGSPYCAQDITAEVARATTFPRVSKRLYESTRPISGEDLYQSYPESYDPLERRSRQEILQLRPRDQQRDEPTSRLVSTSANQPSSHRTPSSSIRAHQRVITYASTRAQTTIESGKDHSTSYPISRATSATSRSNAAVSQSDGSYELMANSKGHKRDPLADLEQSVARKSEPSKRSRTFSFGYDYKSNQQRRSGEDSHQNYEGRDTRRTSQSHLPPGVAQEMPLGSFPSRSSHAPEPPEYVLGEQIPRKPKSHERSRPIVSRDSRYGRNITYATNRIRSDSPENITPPSSITTSPGDDSLATSDFVFDDYIERWTDLSRSEYRDWWVKC